MEIGDKIKIIDNTGNDRFFSVGDIAEIKEIGHLNLWADFNNQGNESVFDDGIWNVIFNNMEVIT